MTIELALSDIQEMSPVDIYESLKKHFSIIYNLFDFLFTSRESYKDIVLDEIESSKSEYNGTTAYKDFIKIRVVSTLRQRVLVALNDDSQAYDIICRYIRQNFNKKINPENANELFELLDNFFDDYEFIPSVDLISKLLVQNDIFKTAIETIYSNCNSTITSGNFEAICENKLLILIIEIYCAVNNISVSSVPQGDNIDDPYEPTTTNSTSFCYNTYDSEINQISPLEPEEMAALFTQYNDIKGKIKQIKDTGDNLPETQKNLRNLKRQSMQIRTTIIESNLRLVRSIANKYTGRGMHRDDLIQEGNIGLIKAIEKFDVKKGYRFSTYATWWIRQAIGRSIAEKNGIIRIPVHRQDKITQMMKFIERFTIEKEREPTVEEIAKGLGITTKYVKELFLADTSVISMDGTVDEDEKTPFGNFVPDPYASEAYSQIARRILLEEIILSANLKKREEDILRYRFGLADGRYKTLEEVGHKFNVTRERIRQIEAKTIKKLRRASEKKSLPNTKTAGYKTKASKNYLKERRREKESANFYELCEDWGIESQEQVDFALQVLHNNDKDNKYYSIINTAYPDGLDKPRRGELTSAQQSTLYTIIKNKMLRYVKYYGSKSPDDIQDLGTGSTGRKTLSFYELCKNWGIESQEQVDFAIQVLHNNDKDNRCYNVINKMYPDGLDKPRRGELTSAQKSTLYTIIKNKMLCYVKYYGSKSPDDIQDLGTGSTGRKTLSFYELCKNWGIESQEQVDFALQMLYNNDKDNRCYNVINTAYPDGLDKPRRGKLTSTQQSTLYTIIKSKMKYYAKHYGTTENLRYGKKTLSFYELCQKWGIESQEQVDFALQVLHNNDRDNRCSDVINKMYPDGLDKPGQEKLTSAQQSILYTIVKNKMLRYVKYYGSKSPDDIQDLGTGSTGRKTLSFYELCQKWGIESQEQVDFALQMLYNNDKNNKYHSIIKTAYPDGLDKPRRGKLTGAQQNTLYAIIKSKIQYYIQQYYNKNKDEKKLINTMALITFNKVASLLSHYFSNCSIIDETYEIIFQAMFIDYMSLSQISDTYNKDYNYIIQKFRELIETAYGEKFKDEEFDALVNALNMGLNLINVPPPTPSEPKVKSKIFYSN